MRLTLRTLLAYLDNTLDPQDAELLRQKVEQSGFATQMVAAIRASLCDPRLSAPAPDSVHPIEEPNMMSNYLDSSLAPEQVAEIEKACLESLPNLAEAAACHQILTMVLGKPADVSDELRGRIHAMVDFEGNIVGAGPAAIAGEIGPRYSGVELDDSADQASTLPPGAPPVPAASDAANPSSSTGGRPTPPPRQSDVPPVGASDSGVFEAAVRLKEQSHQFAGAGTALDASDPPAGSRPLSELERSDFYEGDVRPSRITPWIVSLALVAALLFAVSRIFAPLIGPKVADNTNPDGVQELVVDPATATPATEDADPTDNQNAVVPESESPTEDDSEPPTGSESETPPPDSAIDEEMTDEVADSDAPPIPTDAVTETDGTGDSNNEMADPNSSETGEPGNDPDAPPIPPGMDEPRIAAAPTADSMQPDVTADPSDTAIDPDAPPAPDAPIEEVTAATLSSDDSLVGVWKGGAWNLVPPEEPLAVGQKIVCAPEYRAQFQVVENPEVSLSVVGPSEFRFTDIEATVGLDVKFGRGLVRMLQPGQGVSFSFGDAFVIVTSESEDASLAYEVMHRRELGADPMVDENHQTEIQLSSVSGNFSVQSSADPITLAAGSQVSIAPFEMNGEPLEARTPLILPVWIDPEIDSGSLESEAADSLLELVGSDDSGSLLLALSVALDFRRNEVAALAGMSMLAFGDASAYFGVDGLLNKPNQRLYWSSHLDALREMVDRGTSDAAAVRTAIAGENAEMDHADGDTLFRLIVGYSQDQLKTGGDAELVADLESVSMPVRVLASETLRDICGTTLYFKPEEEVASRREEVIKKWKARLRNEPIRYSESE